MSSPDKQEWVEIRDNFFPITEILTPLTSLIMENTSRKLVFNLNDLDHPNIIQRAVEFSKNQTGVPYNHAILKKYMPDTPSAAYERHVDPKSVSNAPLFLCTFDGTATFDIWDDDNMKTTYDSKPNRLMLANEHLDHRVSPPTNESWIRSLLFLGIKK